MEERKKEEIIEKTVNDALPEKVEITDTIGTKKENGQGMEHSLI